MCPAIMYRCPIPAPGISMPVCWWVPSSPETAFLLQWDGPSSFVELAIKTTFSYGTDTRYGVMLENALPWLTHKEILKNFKIL